MTAEPHALYELNINVVFLGPLPEDDNPAAPEATPARFAAVDAVTRELGDSGFTVAACGHGSRRTGTVDVNPRELAVRRSTVTPGLEQLRGLVAQLLDPEPCSFDHHGDCQEHGHASPCPHGRAKSLGIEPR